MLGIAFVLIFSWFLLWFIHREHIEAIGILPNSKRIKRFLLGSILMAIFCTVNLLGQSFFKEISYQINPNYGWSQALQGIFWTFKSALFEELVFRAAILYLAIRKIGIINACLLCGIAFGVYHWFSYGMFGRGLIPMIYVFFVTGASGWMFAYAFAKTKSLYLPLGLHFGWIATSIVIFSDGPLGHQLLIPIGQSAELNGWATLFFFLWQALVVPGLVTWYLRKYYP